MTSRWVLSGASFTILGNEHDETSWVEVPVRIRARYLVWHPSSSLGYDPGIVHKSGRGDHSDQSLSLCCTNRCGPAGEMRGWGRRSCNPRRWSWSKLILTATGKLRHHDRSFFLCHSDRRKVVALPCVGTGHCAFDVNTRQLAVVGKRSHKSARPPTPTPVRSLLTSTHNISGQQTFKL
jgi:hypothetical protein